MTKKEAAKRLRHIAVELRLIELTGFAAAIREIANGLAK